MKLLLASDGQFIFSKGMDLVGIPKESMNIAYVTTASKGGTKSPKYVAQYKQVMRERGYNFGEVDIEGKTEKELEVIFKNKNTIYVEGGNTFRLLKAVKESGFDKVAKGLVEKEVVYIGVSAGAYIACPTIEVSTWRPDSKNRYGLTDFTALHFVDFLLKAHYTDDMNEWLVPKIKEAKYPVRIIRDGQGILVEDDSSGFFGEGEEVKLL